MEPWLDSIAYLPAGLKFLCFKLHDTPLEWYSSRRGVQSLKDLRKLVEQAAQKVPEAVISIHSVYEKPLEHSCQVAVDDILAYIRGTQPNR